MSLTAAGLRIPNNFPLNRPSGRSGSVGSGSRCHGAEVAASGSMVTQATAAAARTAAARRTTMVLRGGGGWCDAKQVMKT